MSGSAIDGQPARRNQELYDSALRFVDDVCAMHERPDFDQLGLLAPTFGGPLVNYVSVVLDSWARAVQKQASSSLVVNCVPGKRMGDRLAARVLIGSVVDLDRL